MKKYLLGLLIVPFCAHAWFFDPELNCQSIYEDSDEQENCERRRKYARYEFTESVKAYTGQDIKCPDYDDEGEGLELVFEDMYHYQTALKRRNWDNCGASAGNSYDSPNTDLEISKVKVYCWNALCETKLSSPYCETVLLYELAAEKPAKSYYQLPSRLIHPYDYYEVGYGEVIQGDVREYGRCDSRLYLRLQEYVDAEDEHNERNSFWGRARAIVRK